jgi:spermidine synthase
MLPESRTALRPGFERLVLAAFVLSGAAGLIHELAWARLFRLVMGNTTQAIAAVMSVFMAGLALGSLVGGRVIDRRQDPLRVFAILEAAVGAYCLVLPWLIAATTPIFRAAYARWSDAPAVMTLVRLAVAAALLLPPATMMGASLPILTRWFAPARDLVGRSAGRLYGFNTLGAVLGVAAAGFWLIPNFGVRLTIVVGALVNLLVAAAGYWLHRQAADAGMTATAPVPAPSRHKRRNAHRAPPLAVTPAIAIVLLVGYGLSGMAAMTYELAWTRTLSLLIGSSVYAFALMLMAFVLGLAAGSLAFARRVTRVRDPLRTLAGLQAGVALSSLLVVPLLGALPVFVTELIAGNIESFWRLQAVEFALVLAITLVPTLLMGAMFPLVTHALANSRHGAGRSVGGAYGANTIGAIAGSLLGGYALIPALGIQRTIFAAAAASTAVGCAWLLASSRTPWFARLAGAATAIGVAAAAMVAIPPWDPARMSFGPFVQAATLPPAEALSEIALQKRLAATETIFYDEGLAATVAVKRSPSGAMMLLTNGQIEASSRGGESQQLLLAHIPLLLHPHPQDALVIGLASGMTLAAAARHPLRSIDCVELSTGVVEATRLFREANHDVLDDPRVRLIIGDGRNHVALTDRRYDVIISQPSDPATAGVADLFTREFFAHCRARLNDRGVLCVWFKGSTIDVDVFRSVVRTFAAAFDDVTVWSATDFTEYMLVGARGELAIDHGELARRLAEPRLAEDLRRVHIESMPDLLANLVTCRTGGLRFAQHAPLHTDDNALVEFSAPRTVFSRRDPQPLVDALLAARDSGIEFLKPNSAPPSSASPTLDEVRKLTSRFFAARVLVFRAMSAYERGDEEATQENLIAAGKLNPRDPSLRTAVVRLHRSVQSLIGSLQIDEAIRITRQILQILPDSAPDHFRLACLLRDRGDNEQAIAEFLRVLQVDADHTQAHFNLAVLEGAQDHMPEAVAHYRAALRGAPDMVEALNNLAWIIMTEHDAALGEPSEAVSLAERATALTGRRNPSTLDTLAGAYEAAGQIDKALATAETARLLAIELRNIDLVAVLDRRIALYQRMIAERHGER